MSKTRVVKTLVPPRYDNCMDSSFEVLVESEAILLEVVLGQGDGPFPISVVEHIVFVLQLPFGNVIFLFLRHCIVPSLHD